MNTNALYGRGAEIFSLLLLSAEDSVKSDAAQFEMEVKHLQGIIQLAIDFSKDDEVKRWLGFSSEELNKSYTAFLVHDLDSAYKHLDSSEQYFKDARIAKKTKATFIVGPDGQAQKL